MEQNARQRAVLDTALLAGQIMCESNAESYRVEDTMNRILTLSRASYAVAISFSTSIYAMLEDPSYENGYFTGMRRITKRANNMYKISQVNTVSRQLLGGKLEVDEALAKLYAIRKQEPQYNKLENAIGMILMTTSFGILFGGGWQETVAAALDGVLLALSDRLIGPYFLNDAVQNVVQALIVTVGAHLLQTFLFPLSQVNIVTVATLMPLVPGTAITNSLRDIFREDYLAGGARALEAFFCALMIAIGSLVGLAVVGSVSG